METWQEFKLKAEKGKNPDLSTSFPFPIFSLNFTCSKLTTTRRNVGGSTKESGSGRCRKISSPFHWSVVFVGPPYKFHLSFVICSLKDRLRNETARHFRISSTQAHRKRSRYVRLRFSIYVKIQFELLFFGIYCTASSSTCLYVSPVCCYLSQVLWMLQLTR